MWLIGSPYKRMLFRMLVPHFFDHLTFTKSRSLFLYVGMSVHLKEDLPDISEEVTARLLVLVLDSYQSYETGLRQSNERRITTTQRMKSKDINEECEHRNAGKSKALVS